MLERLPREEWCAALRLAPQDELQRLLDAISKDWRIVPKALPQAGLGMLKLRDSAFNEPFYLGEFPLATCWIGVVTADGREVEGAALTMDDEVQQAERLALCDAVLSARLPGWQSLEVLLAQGWRKRRLIAQERKAMLARTRVDFSLLDDVGDDDA